MNIYSRTLVAAGIAACLPLAPLAAAEPGYRPAATAQAVRPQGQYFSQQQLDRILAPIALYPDALLAQILMAATYPLEVVQASRWSEAHPRLQGEEAVRAVADMGWDPSVQSLAAFPRVLALMNERLDWTQQLGDAFLAQEADVADTVQRLRQRAWQAGQLDAGTYTRVERQRDVIRIVWIDPAVAYLPWYDSRVVYGAWWWPVEPVYWAPPRHARHVRVVNGFAWDEGIALGAGFFYGGFDWPGRRVTVIHMDSHRDHDRSAHRPPPRGEPRRWTHHAEHRRGVPYHHRDLQRHYGRTTASQSRPGYLVAPAAEPQAPSRSLRRHEAAEEQVRRPRDGVRGVERARTEHRPRRPEREHAPPRPGRERGEGAGLDGRGQAMEPGPARPAAGMRPPESRFAPREPGASAPAQAPGGALPAPVEVDPEPAPLPERGPAPVEMPALGEVAGDGQPPPAFEAPPAPEPAQPPPAPLSAPEPVFSAPPEAAAPEPAAPEPVFSASPEPAFSSPEPAPPPAPEPLPERVPEPVSTPAPAPEAPSPQPVAPVPVEAPPG